MYISLDIGGTKIMVAAFSDAHTIIARKRADTPRSLNEGLELLKNLTREVSAGARITAIGASAGGPLDYKTGIVSPLHMPEWRGVPLKQIFEDEFHVPFAVDVDTNTAALAEYTYGGQKVDRLLYITISTGMGGGFVVDGELYRGTNGSHPEIAHQAIPYKLPITGPIHCPCGAVGCLEAIASGTAIQRHYGKPASELTSEEWTQVGYNVGQGLRNAAALYAPSVIALGGGVSVGGGAHFIGAIEQTLLDNLKIVPVPTIAVSRLGYDSALWGGLAMASIAASRAS